MTGPWSAQALCALREPQPECAAAPLQPPLPLLHPAAAARLGALPHALLQGSVGRAGLFSPQLLPWSPTWEAAMDCPAADWGALQALPKWGWCNAHTLP